MTTTTQAEEIKAAISELKTSVRSAVSAAMTMFQHRTGISPSHIDVEIIETTTNSDQMKQHHLSSVSVRFEL